MMNSQDSRQDVSSEQATHDAWELTFDRWDAAEQPHREALTTLGNGYFATRGAFEEERAGNGHYPGTYLGGGYDRITSHVAGRVVENEDLVNWPNWLPLTFRIEGGEWFRIDRFELLEFREVLELRRGVLVRHIRFRDTEGRETTLESTRFVHIDHRHCAGILWRLVPVNWSGSLEIRSGIDGTVTNDGVARYRELNGDHLEIINKGSRHGDTICLAARTRQSHLVMAQAARTQVFRDGRPTEVKRTTEVLDQEVSQTLFVPCVRGQEIRIEKVVAVFSSLDRAISEPLVEACTYVGRLGTMDELLASHRQAWASLWCSVDTHLHGVAEEHQLALRLHLFHILQVASENTVDEDVGIPARGWHGEAYRGHIFWDELFVFPFLNLHHPEVTRALLMYRWRRLTQAREAAKDAGLAGAMFPWQSGSNGREESQIVHLNPVSGRWIPDHTLRQRHVNAAIAHNIWDYVQASDDLEFLSFYGAEMLLEIARFWASISTYNPRRKRFEIKGVVGPDEFHTHYPGSDSPGIDNNAYTNVMAVWVLQTALKALDRLRPQRCSEILTRLNLTPEERAQWEDISRRMYVPMDDDGIIEQFDGWEALEELDWDNLRRRHGDIQRLDRILEAEGQDINAFKATKQADVLMLFYLLSAEELGELFKRLGYPWDPAMIPRNVKYYSERTSHGSTLSRIVHGWVLSRTDREQSWELFARALASDLEDIQGGTTSEGIHLGAMAGTVDMIQRCYTGVEIRDDVLWINPRLPRELTRLWMPLRYRGHRLSLDIRSDRLTVRLDTGWSSPVRIGVQESVCLIRQGEEQQFDLTPAPVEESVEH